MTTGKSPAAKKTTGKTTGKSDRDVLIAISKTASYWQIKNETVFIILPAKKCPLHPGYFYSPDETKCFLCKGKDNLNIFDKLFALLGKLERTPMKIRLNPQGFLIIGLGTTSDQLEIFDEEKISVPS